MTDPTITPPPPIVIPDTPVIDQTQALLRDLAKVIGAALVTHGVVSQASWDAYAQVGIGILVVLAPVVMSQLKTRMNWGKLKKLEPYAPDSVAVAKTKP